MDIFRDRRDRYPNSRGSDAYKQDEIAMKLMACTFSQEMRSNILSSTDEDAEKWMETLQDWLDRVELDHPLRRPALYMLQNLTDRCGRFPPVVLLSCGNDLVEEQEIFREGGFGSTYRGMYRNMAVLIKKLKPGQDSTVMQENLRRLRRETGLWWQLRHPRLVELLGVDKETFLQRNEINLVMSLVRGRNLMEMVVNSPYNFKNSVVPIVQGVDIGVYEPSIHRHMLLTQIAEGIHYLHRQEITHGDISGPNILIDSDMHVRLCDFGLSVVGRTTQGRVATTAHPAGTPNWMSPERLKTEHRLKREVDIWAFGCVCYAICSGRVPYYDLPHESQIQMKILTGDRPNIPTDERPGPVFACIGDDPGLPFWDMVARCWKQDPTARIHISNILAYLAGGKQVDGLTPSSVLCTARIVETSGPPPGFTIGHLPVTVGDVMQIYDMLGDNWLARRPDGCVGYVGRHLFDNPFYFKAEVLVGEISSQPRKWQLHSRWLRPDAKELRYLMLAKGEIVDVITVSEERWTVLDQHSNLGYMPPANLKVVQWPKYHRSQVQTVRVLCDFFPANPSSYFSEMTRGETFALMPRRGEWVIGWRLPDTQHPRLLSQNHLRAYEIY